MNKRLRLIACAVGSGGPLIAGREVPRNGFGFQNGVTQHRFRVLRTGDWAEVKFQLWIAIDRGKALAAAIERGPSPGNTYKSMASIPKRVETRLVAGIKKFQPVLTMAKSKDVNESDTVVIINDLLAEIFGYSKYVEITSEFAIRGTYCDLAITLDGKLAVLIEAKAIGIELKDLHVKQAIDYAANQGVDWVVLSNAIHWRIYKVIFGKPIDQELVCEFDFLSLDHKDETHLQFLYLLTKEGWAKSAVGEYHEQKQALSRFHISAAILSESVLSTIKRELKRVSPDVKIDNEQIRGVVSQEVIKREILENEKFQQAEKAIGRAANKAARARKEDGGQPQPTNVGDLPASAPADKPTVSPPASSVPLA